MKGAANRAIMKIRLTVADHDRNGFVTLAEWPLMPEQEARSLIAGVDATVSAEAEPDHKDAPFWFILDLIGVPDGDLLDTSSKALPTQTAMAIAPEPVQAWLNERPEPDLVMYRRAPLLSPNGIHALLAGQEAVHV